MYSWRRHHAYEQNNNAERQAEIGVGLPFRVVRKKAFALIAVLWVVILAGLILLGVRKAGHVNLAMAFNELESVRAQWLARAGVEQAVAMLDDDDTAVDDMLEYWYSDRLSLRQVELLRGEFSVKAPPGPELSARRVRYGLVDHNGKLNVNTAGREELEDFCDLADWQVSSLLDWRDGDAQTSPGGAEGGYYQGLEYPYEIRNGNFQTLGELGLVKGMDLDVLYGEDANNNGVLDENENNGATSPPPDNADDKLRRGLRGLCTIYSFERNRTAAGEERVNFNTADKDTLKEEFNFTDALANAVTQHQANRQQGGERQQSIRFNNLMELIGLRGQQNNNQQEDSSKVNEITIKWVADHWDQLTLTDDERLPGRVNINTASREVLKALPKLTSSEVQSILRRQTGGKGPFASVGELLTDEILNEEQFKAVAEKLTVRSSVFEVRSCAVTSHGIRREIIAVVDRSTDPASVLYWYQNE
jgi:type II secretory pathway component PulK